MNPEALATLRAHLLPALAAAPSETRRLFHGRGRCWPGLEQLTVDWLQGVLLVSLFKAPEPEQLAALKLLLARLELGDAIPEALYHAVAPVIAYIFGLASVRPGVEPMARPTPKVPESMRFDAEGRLQTVEP